MQKKVNLAMLALFSCSLAMAQNEKTDQNVAQGLDENSELRQIPFRSHTCR